MQTVIESIPAEWQNYKPRPPKWRDQPEVAERYRQAWQTARQISQLLYHQFSAKRVVVFGSLVRPGWFNPWSDIDLAVWGIPDASFYQAVGAAIDFSPVFEVDLVDVETCRPSLQQKINREGVDIFMDENLLDLAERIRHELSELEIVVNRVEQGWYRAKQSNDDYYVDSVALNLHGFYSGMERLFEMIAIQVDGGMPSGSNWHQQLLRQMVVDKHEQRLPVISESTLQLLDKYRSFRHVVRNVYTFKFDPYKIEQLVEQLPITYSSMKNELLRFTQFLEIKGVQ
jgi:predicted nucleotidyltransferase